MLAPVVHGDGRGFFVETFRASALAEHGIRDEWVQDNHSRSARGVVRGMHFHGDAEGAAKLVRCGRGEILDVLVDLRRDRPRTGAGRASRSPTRTCASCTCRVGFAHGFCVLSDVADVLYKQSRYYDPAIEVGFAYDDPAVGIEWPGAGTLLASDRDASAPRLEEIVDRLPF